ncbi:ATP-dependent RNA helicase HrpB [Anatilimnocola aggregata]|uniref:ATP-dependent RNA helicase HrpB n=1 Tax=Anatilimnocola aggregata TaxID=2528021 RepID=A0A517YMI5_9BACT|nr:ATP-dependent RNA helicase HrpA [Anatilimnocola aggregata]QDU31433.1 ATP-dependent RNA helicase HrpB [Anatilimnocola aggregata]
MLYYAELEAQLATAMQRDRHRLRNQLRAICQAEQQGRPFDRNLAKLQDELEKSLAEAARRKSLVPKIEYDESLPVVEQREVIAEAIRNHPVVVICGETGSGKSTQLPKICLEIGRGVTGLIGHTQPRRIAARSIAARVAEELNSTVGKLVGYKIRFADQTTPETLIKVMTDGVLLAESQTDRYFEQYDTLIIDEAHERSLNIDFLLGYLHRLIVKRPEFRLIITSATLDAQRFAEHFGHAGENGKLIPAPIVEVSGRTYPVETLYRPLSLLEDEIELDPVQGVLRGIDELSRLGQGDILVFLPTERDILEVSHKLRGRMLGGNAEVLPLYARLSTAEQNKVFRSHTGRRIVLATNVAESSLTVPGIHYVVDTGTARVSRYSARSKLQRLPIEAISQASADQRKGRCGRIGPGVCIRLYSEEDYARRERYTPPEIQRTNLAAVVLQTLALDLGTIEDFPFLDPPRAESIRDGYKTLFELGAIDDSRQLTPVGRQLAKLPADPRIGRILLAADREGCLADVLIIAAALETQDPRERPADRAAAADEAHRKFQSGESDFLSFIKLWDFYARLKADLSRNQLRRACSQNFLSELRMREWHDVHRQLLDMVTQFGLRAGRRRWQTSEDDAPKDKDAYDSIHRSLLAGLLANIALRSETAEYNGAGGNKLFLWPGSGVFQTKPKWIVAADLVETTKNYARTVARIDPDWIEPLASHLVNYHYTNPQWDKRSGATMANERVSLYGLTIIARRRVRYGPIDPLASRELMIRSGLVEGEFETRAPFFRHNQQLREELDHLAAKARRRDLLVEDQMVYDFYAGRIPADVYDAPRLEKWRRSLEEKQPRILHMEPADLLGQELNPPEPEEFPEQLQLDRLQLPLDYHFEPGAENDGLTATVPREAIFQLSAERLGWLIPGLLAEKVEHLIRSLPKQQRRNLIPAPDVAKRTAKKLHFAKSSFLLEVARALSLEAGEPISPDAFDLTRLPQHLVLKVRVVDEQGKVLAEGRDIEQLREQVGAKPATATSAPDKSPWHRDGVKSWEWDILPEAVDISRGGLTFTRFPAIVDTQENVALRLTETLPEAEQLTWAGIRRLIVLDRPRRYREQVENLPKLSQMQVLAAKLCQDRTLIQQLVDLLAQRSIDLALPSWKKQAANSLPRSKDEFNKLLKLATDQLLPAVQEVSRFALPLFEAYHQARLALEQARPETWQPALDDMRAQFGELIIPNFLAETPWTWLQHFPRYLKGISLRLQKIVSTGLPRDRQALAQVTPRVKAWHERREVHRKHHVLDAELDTFRWQLEEFRISLFAQELGTSQAISAPRLDKQWEKVRLM